MKFAICNLGCKVNNYEANWYSEQLSKKYQEVDFKEKADIYIINSCTVTNMAGSKSRQMLHRARKANPNACIAMVSCYVQMEFENSELFEDADILVGSKDKIRLPQLIEDYLQNHQKISLVEPFERCAFEEMELVNYNQTRAYLKIQDGCNQFCGYCTIPYARARERSLDSDKAIEMAKKLVASNHQEIVLTGIHTGRYNDGKINLTQLIQRMLDEIPNLMRIRLSSIEMTEVSDELIELMKNDERIARHLHIPLQVGNDRLLKLNNRPYNSQQYLKRIQEIRQQIPDISISSDVIVGLPTETDDEFQDTVQLIRECQLSFLHVFPYARKKGTKDYSLSQVDNDKIKERANILGELSKQLYQQYASQFVGKTVDVLFETENDGLLKGHCSQYIPCQCKADASERGKMIRVKAVKVVEHTLYTAKGE